MLNFSELEVFPKFHAVPFSKLLTFYRKGPFVLTARYSDKDVERVHKANQTIGQFHIQSVKPGAQGESQKVKVKVRLNLHGTFQIVSATLMEKQPAQSGAETASVVESNLQTDGETMDTETEGADGAPPTAAADTAKMDTEDDAAGDKAPAAKQIVKSVDLIVESKTSSLTPHQVQQLGEREAELQSQDRQERDRIDSKNALEEFVLAIRTRVNDEDDLQPYMEDDLRQQLVQIADDAENWLYEDGEDCEKSLYVQKLQLLQVCLTHPFFSTGGGFDRFQSVLNHEYKSAVFGRKWAGLRGNRRRVAISIENPSTRRVRWSSEATRRRCPLSRADFGPTTALFFSRFNQFDLNAISIKNRGFDDWFCCLGHGRSGSESQEGFRACTSCC